MFIARIEKINKIDSQIAFIEKALKEGDHIATGLTIGLNVGPITTSEYEYGLEDIQLCWPTQKILEVLLEGLQESRKSNLKLLVSDYQAVQQFLRKQKDVNIHL